MSSIKKFEFLEVAGSHKDVGRAIGTKFGSIIRERITERQKRIVDYDKYLKNVEPYYNATKERFPNLIIESEEVAKAAGVGVADYFSINSHEVATDFKHDHCTVAVSFGEKGATVGHNEDWEGASPDALYILKATIKGTTFLGLQYKVATPGVAVTINNWGLVQCINYLDQAPQIGVPKNFVARAVLECKTLGEAEKVIRETKRASGFNHVLVQGHKVWNIETAADKIAVIRIDGDPYVHTNHYLVPEMKTLEKSHTESSIARYKRAKEIVNSSMDETEMEELLSDTKNVKYPISRKDATLGSFIAQPSLKEVYICYGPPDKGKYQKYESA